MTDKTELKRLAAELIAANDLFNESPQDNEAGDAWSLANDRFTEAASPEVILALIADNEALTARINDMHADRVEAVAEIVVQGLEVDQLTTENEALRGLYQMHKATETREMRYLKTENEALRKDAERYRWLRGQNWSQSEMAVVCQPKKAVKLGFDCSSEGRLDSAIDSAMSEGEQS